MRRGQEGGDGPAGQQHDPDSQKRLSPSEPVHIAVVIPTFRRPSGLRRLLKALADQTCRYPVRIHVADNDADGHEGMTVIADLKASGYPLDIDAFIVSERGLCNVRNALVARALRKPDATHIAMIDDDEWPDSGWLDALIEGQQATGADIVAGPVVSVFEGEKPAWTTHCRLFLPEKRPDGPCEIVWGVNNVLITRSCLQTTTAPWFDMAFNEIGGEDVDAFVRWQSEGRTFAWVQAAQLFEAIPPARARIGWVLRRGWRIGTSDVVIRFRREPGWQGKVKTTGKAFAGFLASVATMPLRLLLERDRINGLYDLTKSLAKLYAVCGGRYYEYRSVRSNVSPRASQSP